MFLPVVLLAFFSTVKNTATSRASAEFVLTVWLVAGCTFKRFWNELFVKLTESQDSIRVSLFCRFPHQPACCFNGLLDTVTLYIENTQIDLRHAMSLPCCCLVIFCCSLVISLAAYGT